MKYYEFQRELLKMTAYREEKGKPFNPLCAKLNDRVYISPDSHYMIGVPDFMFYLDLEKVSNGAPEWTGCKKMLEFIDYGFEAIDTSITITQGKTKMRKFELQDANHTNVYIDEQYLKYFDDCDFVGTNGVSPLYAKVCDDIAGFILPINYKEE